MVFDMAVSKRNFHPGRRAPKSTSRSLDLASIVSLFFEMTDGPSAQLFGRGGVMVMLVANAREVVDIERGAGATAHGIDVRITCLIR